MILKNKGRKGISGVYWDFFTALIICLNHELIWSHSSARASFNDVSKI